MKKNVLILHLESVSRANLWQYRIEMGTIWRLMSQSFRFSRFYPSATSTDMAMTDFCYGDSSLKDFAPTYQISKDIDFGSGDFSHVNLDLMRAGYKYYYFGSSPYSKMARLVKKHQVYVNNPNLSHLVNDFKFFIEMNRHSQQPFFAYFWDDSAHLAYPSQIKDAAESAPDRLRTAYALIDASVNRVISNLIEAGLWEKTIIIGFGDHGDEAWSHGLNRGYCHSIAPYSSVAWTPMFMFDPEQFDSTTTSRVASTIDLKHTILGMAFPGAAEHAGNTRFSGINLLKERRKYAFSQNMFALQREQTDPEQGMLKGYSITDGAFRLVASSGGRKPQQGGMALYCEQADPANSLNLLKFFSLDKNGDIKKFSPPQEAAAKHFQSAFGPPQVESIWNAFEELKPQLTQFIKDKEAAALDRYRHFCDSSVAELAAEYDSFMRNSMKWSPVGEETITKFKRLKGEFEKVEPQLFPDSVFSKMKPSATGLEI